jgi:phenylpyruvate tautomerase PptA (4-oxalocrotonate tautomerase family)
LARDLLAALLSWEGAPDNQRSQSLAWAFIHVVDRVEVASSPSGRPHYRVGVRTPQGALDSRRRAGLVAEATELVLRAEGTVPSPSDEFRVWVILDEVAEGCWGAEGRIWHLSDIVSYVADPGAPTGRLDVSSSPTGRG